MKLYKLSVPPTAYSLEICVYCSGCKTFGDTSYCNIVASTHPPLTPIVFLQGVRAGPQGGAAGVAEKDQQDGMSAVAPPLDLTLSVAVSLGLRLVAFLSLLWLCV